MAGARRALAYDRSAVERPVTKRSGRIEGRLGPWGALPWARALPARSLSFVWLWGKEIVEMSASDAETIIEEMRNNLKQSDAWRRHITARDLRAPSPLPRVDVEDDKVDRG